MSDRSPSAAKQARYRLRKKGHRTYRGLMSPSLEAGLVEHGILESEDLEGNADDRGEALMAGLSTLLATLSELPQSWTHDLFAIIRLLVRNATVTKVTRAECDVVGKHDE